jgi:hypothetical protein
VHPADQVIPEHLARVCDHVVRLEYPIDDPRGAKQLQDVIERYTSKCDQR